jgi:hypothetical protein
MPRVFLILALAVTPPVNAQQVERPPKDITGSIDSFTGDTIWVTKYGRLDNPQGCGRDNIAVIWKLAQGPRGRTEMVTYEWIMVDAPFSARATWLGGVGAVLNIEGELIEIERHPLPSSSKLDGGGKTKTETATFVLPPGTLERIAVAKLAKLRFVGTERTCQGDIEQNMKVRIRSLLEWMRD